MPQRFWLFKTEPSSFSIASLADCPRQITCWDGVRNYQARNMLRDEVAVGDGVLIYHSRQPPMAVVGTAEITRAGYPDPSQFDCADDHFDPLSPADRPRWFAVDLRLDRIFGAPVTRQRLREAPQLAGLLVLEVGCRLSIQPVGAAHHAAICALGTADNLPRE